MRIHATLNARAGTLLDQHKGEFVQAVGRCLAAAAKLVGKQVALGIIPLGTLNRLARDLKIPFDAEEAAAARRSASQR